MAMARGDFVALADAFIRVRDHIPKDDSGSMGTFMQCLAEVAEVCERSNHRFNRARWLGYIAGTNGASGQTNYPGERV